MQALAGGNLRFGNCEAPSHGSRGLSPPDPSRGTCGNSTLFRQTQELDPQSGLLRVQGLKGLPIHCLPHAHIHDCLIRGQQLSPTQPPSQQDPGATGLRKAAKGHVLVLRLGCRSQDGDGTGGN